jgi:hypothetical protein
MATTRKAPAKTPAKTAAAKSGTKFNPADLPETGSVQFRQNGEYKASLRALAAFAKGDPTNMGHVKALVHLGWVKPGGVNAASKSPAFTTADNAGLPDECFAVGEPAAPQISANLQALAEAGAPVEALDGLWSAYVGV